MLFAFGFLLTLPPLDMKDDTLTTIAYSQIAAKIVSLLATLEVEEQFLVVPSKKEKLWRIFEYLVEGLKAKENCTIPIDDINVLHVSRCIRRPVLGGELVPRAAPHLVPVPITPLGNVVNRDSDLAVQKVVPYMDGARSIRHIAHAADVDVDLVLRAVELMLARDSIGLVDVFQFSNIYTPTQAISKLLRDPEMVDACLHDCWKGFQHLDSPRRDVLDLYCKLRRDKRLSEVCKENWGKVRDVDIRTFVTFGVLNGIIRRVHAYPVYEPDLQDQHPGSDAFTSQELAMMNGKRTMDEICSMMWRRSSEIEEACLTHPAIVVVYK